MSIDVASIQEAGNGWRQSEEASLGKEADLTEEQKQKLNILIDRFANVPSRNDEEIGNTNFKHHIEIDGPNPTVHTRFPMQSGRPWKSR